MILHMGIYIGNRCDTIIPASCFEVVATACSQANTILRRIRASSDNSEHTLVTDCRPGHRLFVEYPLSM